MKIKGIEIHRADDVKIYLLRCVDEGKKEARREGRVVLFEPASECGEAKFYYYYYLPAYGIIVYLLGWDEANGPFDDGRYHRAIPSISLLGLGEAEHS